MRKKYEILQPLLLSTALAIGMLIGFRMQNGQSDFELLERVESENDLGIGRIEEIIRFIDSKYVEDLKEDYLIEDAIKNIISKLDPHSVYIPPDKVIEMNGQIQGTYEGLGLETIYYNDSLVVTSIIEGSPAKKAGIHLFDIVLSINGEKVSGVNAEYAQIQTLMRSSKGDSMNLGVFDFEKQSISTFQLISQDIKIKAADISFMVNDSVGYIQVKRFNSSVYKEFMESLEELSFNASFKHLIIDLRQNPGGYLPETVNIISQLFKEKDKLIVYTKSRSVSETKYQSTGKPFFNVDNLSVLIDEGSASGSEILAGAIQDWDRGVIVGRRSFGKGLVQEQFKLKNGGIIRLTVARYFTPSGRSIQRPYEDRQYYTSFLSERMRNGELASGDSIHYKDSTKFYTKNLERIIYSKGGISPDIFIPADSIYLSDQDLLIGSHLTAIAYSYLKETDFPLPYTFTAFNENEIDKFDIISHLVKYVEENDLNISNDWVYDHQGILFRKVKIKLVELLYGESAKMQYTCQDDPFILESLRAMTINNLIALSN